MNISELCSCFKFIEIQIMKIPAAWRVEKLQNMKNLKHRKILVKFSFTKLV